VVAVKGVGPGGADIETIAITLFCDVVTKEIFRQGAAAYISGTDEKDRAPAGF
jgi:hypothetical protein